MKINKQILNHKRAQIGMTSFLALIICLLALMSIMPNAHATFVSQEKSHTPGTAGKLGGLDTFLIGDNVTFQLTLSVLDTAGGSPITIENLKFIDVLPAGLTYVSGSENHTPDGLTTFSYNAGTRTLTWDFGHGPFTTKPQAVASFTATVDVGAPDYTVLMNSFTADYSETVSGIHSAPTTSDTIRVIHPILDIAKSNPAKVENGQSFNNIIMLTNTGHQATDDSTAVTDNIPSGTTHTAGTATASTGTITTDTATQVVWTGTIAESGTVTITIPVTAATAENSVTDTATYTSVPDYAQVLQTSASCTTKILHPGISLTKTPSSTKVENGSSVTYTYVVTNTGDTVLTVGISDDQFGSIASGVVLAAGENQTFSEDETLTATTTNTATATGVDQTGAEVTATAQATVTVINPAIMLTKTPSSTNVENGAIVTYTYVVTNTGDTVLTVGISDDQFGSIASGVVLAAGENQTFSENETLTATTTNTATATGVDQTGAQVTATAQATVTVINPAIMLTKTPSSTKVENGSSVTYTYVVTNTGDTVLTVGISDDQFGSIASGVVLAAGENQTFSEDETLTATTTNTATATGVDQTEAQVTATAQATVTVINPAIMLTKTPSSTKVENGAIVTYTYVVTNTGDTVLTVGISDDQFGSIASGVVLAAGEDQTFSENETLTATTTNTATATGVDQTGAQVTATAQATVTVIPTENEPLWVNKAPSTTTTILSASMILPGDSVTDTVTVTGLGDPFPMPTGTVTFQVKVDDGSWVTYDTENLSSGTATSVEYVPLIVENYWFRAIYSGDNNYENSQSPDDNEPLMVVKHDTTTTTLLSASIITLGESVTDNAYVTTGLPNPPYPLPTGTITFQVKFDGGSWVTFDIENLVNGMATSIPYVPLQAGQYYFRAIYSGDNIYNGSQSS